MKVVAQIFLYESALVCTCTRETKAYLYCIVDAVHCSLVKMTHLFLQPLLVYGSDLLKQDDAILCKTCILAGYVNVGGKLGFTHF